MRSNRPLRLESLEGRCTPTDVGLIDPDSVVIVPTEPTTTTTESSAFIGGLLNPDGTTTTIMPPTASPLPSPDLTSTAPPPASTGSLGELLDPLGTPINP